MARTTLESVDESHTMADRGERVAISAAASSDLRLAFKCTTPGRDKTLGARGEGLTDRMVLEGWMEDRST